MPAALFFSAYGAGGYLKSSLRRFAPRDDRVLIGISLGSAYGAGGYLSRSLRRFAPRDDRGLIKASSGFASLLAMTVL